jgi:hypothetical protein
VRINSIGNLKDSLPRLKLKFLKKSEKQRFLHRDTGWEERVPLEISVETFSTGKVCRLGEVDFL